MYAHILKSVIFYDTFCLKISFPSTFLKSPHRCWSFFNSFLNVIVLYPLHHKLKNSFHTFTIIISRDQITVVWLSLYLIWYGIRFLYKMQTNIWMDKNVGHQLPNIWISLVLPPFYSSLSIVFLLLPQTTIMLEGVNTLVEVSTHNVIRRGWHYLDKEFG